MIKGSASISNVSTSGIKVYYNSSIYTLTGEWVIISGTLLLGAKSELGIINYWLDEHYIYEYNKC